VASELPLAAGIPRHDSGQSEIEDLHAAVSRAKDVFRFQITMDNAFGVRRRQCFSDGPRQPPLLLPAGNASVYICSQQALSLQEFHDREAHSALVPQIEEHHNFGIAKERRQALPRASNRASMARSLPGA